VGSKKRAGRSVDSRRLRLLIQKQEETYIKKLQQYQLLFSKKTNKCVKQNESNIKRNIDFQVEKYGDHFMLSKNRNTKN
jgi:hypothetical protein